MKIKSKATNKKNLASILIILTFIIIYSKLAYVTYQMEAPHFNSCGGLLLLQGYENYECGKAQTLITTFIFMFLGTIPIFFIGWGFVALNLFYYVFEVPQSTNNTKDNKRAKIFSLIAYLSILPLIIFFLSLVIFDNPNYIINPIPLEDVEPTLWYYLLWIFYSPFIYIYISKYILFGGLQKK